MVSLRASRESELARKRLRVDNFHNAMKSLPAIVILALAHTAAALELTLGFDTLPSAQGWTYSPSGPSHAGQIETNIWNVNGVRLAMNTIGSGLMSPASNIYTQLGMLNAVDPIVVEVTSRMLQFEGGNHGWSFGYENGVNGVSVGFSTTGIRLGTGGVIALDATGFHDYRLEFTPGDATFSFFVDDAFFASGTPTASSLNRIWFGDGSGGSNGRAEMTAYHLAQVPEPGAAMLFAVSVTAMCLRRRRMA
jgi:hypothetical protein